ncbi:hypothetical protein NA57DRAFT_73969 [Rhizodiscina lignyota]|uniref:Secreted RxLR effector peptide protein n=1 Tax=Rhizodiscina lignyota TaxID=1504668 RepID=A0A9P4IJD0_9PEZI|nr:hypothetical protein NA57DRAFT_73969 [Rhizodiscina lignyota]
MRSVLLFAAVLSAVTVLANPIDLNRAEELRFQGRSEHDILVELGVRHPTPSLGDTDLDFINAAEHEKRDALPEPQPEPEPEPKKKKTDAKLKAAIESVMHKTLQSMRRGLELAGVVREAEPAANAYEGMEGLVRKPEYRVRLRM